MTKIIASIWVIIFVFMWSIASFGVDEVQQKVLPRKVQVDSDFNGAIDRVEFYNEAGQVIKVESDTNADDKVDKWVYYENGAPVKSETDTNADGKPDVWSEF